MKRLVICCDGTWNTPDQTHGGTRCPTNVTKLACAVAATDRAGVDQRLYYHRGVGSYGRPRWRGGAFGDGLFHDVRRAYRFIVDNYEPGDEIFLFGFSRGAYTARSTAGLIRNAGVLRRECARHLDDAFALYRARAIKPRDLESELFRRCYSHETLRFRTRIRFIGVWDTVGALGVPALGPQWLVKWLNRRYAFHDTKLSSWVDGAFHALAIDEKRWPFRPTMWTVSTPAPGQRVEQVWFVGCHCDVGGGARTSALSDIALRWMVARASEFNLAWRDGAFTAADGWCDAGILPAPAADPLAPINESRKWLYLLLPWWHRLKHVDCATDVAPVSTARDRLQELPDYRPPGFEVLATTVPTTIDDLDFKDI